MPAYAVPVLVDNGRTFRYPAGTVVSVVDGDTADVIVTVDCGKDVHVDLHYRVRIVGVNAPEKATTEGKLARAAATDRWLGHDVTVDIVRYDNYGGRHDGRISDTAGDWTSWALDNGYAVPYGGGKTPR